MSFYPSPFFLLPSSWNILAELWINTYCLLQLPSRVSSYVSKTEKLKMTFPRFHCRQLYFCMRWMLDPSGTQVMIWKVDVKQNGEVLLLLFLLASPTGQAFSYAGKKHLLRSSFLVTEVMGADQSRNSLVLKTASVVWDSQSLQLWDCVASWDCSSLTVQELWGSGPSKWSDSIPIRKGASWS